MNDTTSIQRCCLEQNPVEHASSPTYPNAWCIPHLFTQSHVLVITGEGFVPIQVHKGQKSLCMDQPSSLEEVDNIIAQQVLLLGTDWNARVITLIDDTDIFILLLYFYKYSAIFMESPVYQHSCVAIKATYLSSIVSVSDIPAIHALSDCSSYLLFIASWNQILYFNDTP